MNTGEWLDRVAYVSVSDIPDDGGEIYLSKFDDSYITRVGMEDNVDFLAERDITEGLTHGVGYSPSKGLWYGWSHRAIYGFTIGSTCKMGACHYQPANEGDFFQREVAFWEDEHHNWTRGLLIKDSHRPQGVQVVWEYSDSVPNENLRGTLGGHFSPFPESFGRGEWTAETMEDAKQMAIDFNEGVS